MGFELAGRHALVTGASSGIGAALAVALARRGATVGVTARREDRLRAVVDECRSHAPQSRMWPADMADPLQVDGLAKAVLDDFGEVDLLVNCAGVPKRRHVTRLEPSVVENVLQVNFLSPTRLTLALLPRMLETEDARIVNVASVAATLSSPGEAAYDASKAALAVFSEAMAVDLWDTGVKVMVVYPGLVDTDLFRVPDNDPPVDAVEPIGTDEVVTAVLDGLAQDALQVYVPGYFADLASGKASNVEGFLAGAAQFVSSRRQS